MRTGVCRTVLSLLLLTLAVTAPAEIVLTTDKPEYTVGEIVHFTATNNGPEVEQLVSDPHFVAFNEDTNACVVGCVGLPVVTTFLVGQTITMDWDTGAVPDAPGHHSVRVAVFDGPTASYLLTDAVNVEPSSWGSLKALYRN
jgi:hypothetical protein